MSLRTISPLFLLLWMPYAYGADPVYTIRTIAGSSFVGDGLPATSAILSTIQGVTLDSAGNLYIADTDAHRVRKITADGVIQTIAGTGAPGFSGDGGPAKLAQLRNPFGLAFDWRGNFYIADLGNARIRKITSDGIIQTIAGGGDQEPADGLNAVDVRFSAPRNIAVDGELAVVFSDFSGHRVYRVSAYGVLSILAGNGRPGSSPDGISARQASLAYPTALAFDSYGGLFLCDSQNRAVRRLQNDSMRTVAQAAAPTGLSFDAAGNLYVADAGGGQVLRLAPSGAVGGLQTVARDVAAMPNGVLYLAQGNLILRRSTAGLLTIAAGGGDPASGDGGRAVDAALRQPAGLARDAQGNVYVADRANHRIRRLAADGTISTIATGLLNAPASVAVDPTGVLYIADTGNHRIQRVSFDARGSATVTTIAGAAAQGFSGDGGPAIWAQLDSPGYIAFAVDGSLYISDTANGRIRQIRNGIIRTLASNLPQPRGIAFDRAANLYITTANPRLSVLTPNGGISLWPDNALPFNGARGVAVAGNGDILVADTGNNRIRRVTPDGRSFVIAGRGFATYGGDDGAALDADLNAPFDVLAGPDDSVWIADLENNRVRRLDPGVPGGEFEPIKALSVLNAASLTAGPIAPGELLSLPDLPADATVYLNEIALPVLRGAEAWIVVPNDLMGEFATIEARSARSANTRDARTGDTKDARALRNANATTEPSLGRAILPVVEAAPALFTRPNTTEAAAINADGTPNSASNSAARESIVSFYATGLGKPDSDGKPLIPVRLTVSGIDTEIVFCGPAPGSPAIIQINARIPGGFYGSGALSVILSAGGTASPTVSLFVL